MSQIQAELLKRLAEAEKVLIGIGGEWGMDCPKEELRSCRLNDPGQRSLKEAYDSLYSLVKDKDYFVVTTVTDGAVYDTLFKKERLVAPCGNIHWRQCRDACTKDIWEEGEVADDICPHCGAPLIGNTIESENYIEEGYLIRWEAYKKWQTTTLNRRLLILELGEDFRTPTVMRWPFEKIVFFNQKSCLYRINESFSQVPKEIRERSAGVSENSLLFLKNLRADRS